MKRLRFGMQRLKSGIWNLKFSRFITTVVFAAIAALAIAFLATDVFARVGGGQSYGGGSHGGGSGGGGGGGGFVFILVRVFFWVAIEHTAIGNSFRINFITLVLFFFSRPAKPQLTL